jgi:hypothetical protein
MSRRLVLVCAVATIATFAPGVAHADPPSVAGLTCAMVSVNDRTGTVASPDTQIGVFDSHVAAVDVHTEGPDVVIDTAGDPATAQAECWAQTGSTYGDVNSRLTSCQGNEAPGAASVDCVMAYHDPYPAPVYVCTQWTAWDAKGDWVSFYYDDATGTLVRTTDPNADSATCVLAIEEDLLPQPVLDVVCPLGDRLPESLGQTFGEVTGCGTVPTVARATIWAIGSELSS